MKAEFKIAGVLHLRDLWSKANGTEERATDQCRRTSTTNRWLNATKERDWSNRAESSPDMSLVRATDC